MKKALTSCGILALGMAMMLSGPATTSAKTSEDGEKTFYNKRDVIEIVVPSKPGGGFDAVGRFMAQYIAKYTEGSPKVQVVNLPGGGGITGVNDFARRKATGFNLLEGGGSVTYPFLVGRKEVKFDFTKWEPLFSLPENSVVLVASKTGVKDPKDILNLKDKSLFYGLDNPTSDLRYLLAFKVLGIEDKVKNIYGYGGISKRTMAVKQGEIDVLTGTAKWYKKKFIPLVESGDGVNLFQFGYMNAEGNFVADQNIPLPTVQELHKKWYGKEPSGPIWEAFQLFGGSVSKLGMGTYVKRDVPPEALKALKNAAKKAMNDPEFHAQLEKVLGVKKILAGEELESMYSQLLGLASNEKTINWTKDWLISEHDAQGLK